MAHTVTEAREMLRLYIAAEKAVLKNQSYTIKDRTFTRANLSSVRAGRKYWNDILDQLTGAKGSGITPRRVVFRDD